MKIKSFGEYFKEYRGATSLQKIADLLHVSKPYLWDIEKGNNKPPQKYEMLIKMAEVLKLDSKEKYIFFDSAKQENDIPLDVKQIINLNPQIIEELRNKYHKGEN